MRTTLLAALASLTLAGCGGAAVSSDAVSNPERPSPSESRASADLASLRTFGVLYGAPAANTCLSAFHHELGANLLSSRSEGGGPPETPPADVPDEAIRLARTNYPEGLAKYLCACARGTSVTPCPES